jgi:hypothetical protein
VILWPNYLPIVVLPTVLKQSATIAELTEWANLLKNVKDQTVFDKANKELEFISKCC